MPLRFTNDRDIHLAQEWIIQMHGWTARHGLEGYDPLTSRPIRIRKAQRHPALRKGKHSGVRPVSHAVAAGSAHPSVAESQALALVALGDLRLFQITGDAVHLDNGLDGLQRTGTPGCYGIPGFLLGYPFPVRAAGLDCPRTLLSPLYAPSRESFSACP